MASFRLCKIIRENHGKPIRQVAFNPKFHTLLATIGDQQANLYDNAHCGDHLDLMCHFVNTPNQFTTAHQRGCPADQQAQIYSCAWISLAGSPEDAFLALGCHSIIQIISVAHSKVVGLLVGHEDMVVDICAHPDETTGLLLSASLDGTVRLWHVETRSCLAVFETTASFAVTWHPSGTSFLSGGARGGVVRWKLDMEAVRAAIPHQQDKQATETPVMALATPTSLAKKHAADIDCLHCLDPQIALSKSVDGQLEVWRFDDESEIARIRVPKTQKGTRSRFGVSSCRRYLCVGNSVGTVFVYELHRTGGASVVAQLAFKRAKAAVRDCAFAANGRHIVVVDSDSYIWRWDAENAPPATKERHGEEDVTPMES